MVNKFVEFYPSSSNPFLNTHDPKINILGQIKGHNSCCLIKSEPKVGHKDKGKSKCPPLKVENKKRCHKIIPAAFA